MRALDKAGIAWADIQPVYLAPADARAAFERGSVDAWAIWDPFYAATEQSIRARALSSGEGLTGNNSFYLASRGLVEHHPQAHQGLVRRAYACRPPGAGLAQGGRVLLAAFSGLDANVVSRFIGHRPRLADHAAQSRHGGRAAARGRRLFRLGVIPRQVKVADIVWQPTAVEYAIHGQTSPAASSITPAVASRL